MKFKRSLGKKSIAMLLSAVFAMTSVMPVVPGFAEESIGASSSEVEQLAPLDPSDRLPIGLPIDRPVDFIEDPDRNPLPLLPISIGTGEGSSNDAMATPEMNVDSLSVAAPEGEDIYKEFDLKSNAAHFNGVEVKFKDNVRIVKNDFTDRLRSIDSVRKTITIQPNTNEFAPMSVMPEESIGNVTDAKALPIDKIEPIESIREGQVVLNLDNYEAYKVEQVTNVSNSKQIRVIDAQLEDIIENYSIPDQTVELNAANVAQVAPGVAMNRAGKNEHVFNFADYKLFDGKVTLNGYAKLISPRVVGHYNRTSYRLGFEAGEQINVAVKGNLNFHKNIKVPLAAYGIDAGIGQATVGIFLVIDAKGNISFEYTVDQGVNIAAGVNGKNFFYIPRSVSTYFNYDSWCRTTHKISGALTVKAGVLPELKLRALGRNILQMEIFFGIEATASLLNRLFTLSIDAVLEARGKVLNKGFTLINKRWNIYKYSRPIYARP